MRGSGSLSLITLTRKQLVILRGTGRHHACKIMSPDGPSPWSSGQGPPWRTSYGARSEASQHTKGARQPSKDEWNHKIDDIAGSNWPARVGLACQRAIATSFQPPSPEAACNRVRRCISFLSSCGGGAHLDSGRNIPRRMMIWSRNSKTTYACTRLYSLLLPRGSRSRKSQNGVALQCR